VKIEEAIQQEIFTDAAQKAGINILYTASWLVNLSARILKPYGISWQQFNILRILLGQKGKPASLRLVSERMIDQMSNTSRLVDKLVAKGLVDRHECPKDRRQVDLLITPKGEEVVDHARQKLDSYMQQQLAHMDEASLKQLSDLLDAYRA
jgi:DNA-binding MarR family transcriptional regulator